MEAIEIRRARYYPASWFFGPEVSEIALSDVQSRQSFVESSKLRLDRTSGGYALVNDRPILFIADLRTVSPETEEWRFIGTIAAHLEACCADLDETATEALRHLDAVVFTNQPQVEFRSFADVKPNTFVYDTEEFRRTAADPLITPAYAASNIVHDSNHIAMYDAGIAYTGVEAETVCWQLQIDNRIPLGLQDYEVEYLTSLIGNPSQVIARIETDPFAQHSNYACLGKGKCSVSAQA